MSQSPNRTASWALCRRLDLPVNPALPELETVAFARPQDAVVSRALALSAVVAHSYGLSPGKAKSWLENEVLWSALTPAESVLLRNGRGDLERFRIQAYSLWAFAWLLGLLSLLAWREGPPNNLVKFFPDLKAGESSALFRHHATLRPAAETVPRLDEAYCIHWACRELRLAGRSATLNESGIGEARRALEWTLFNEGWEEISLDT